MTRNQREKLTYAQTVLRAQGSLWSRLVMAILLVLALFPTPALAASAGSAGQASAKTTAKASSDSVKQDGSAVETQSGVKAPKLWAQAHVQSVVWMAKVQNVASAKTPLVGTQGKGKQ